MVLGITFFIYNFRNLYIDTIQKNISFRTLSVSPKVDFEYFEENKESLRWNEYLENAYDKAINELLKINHVQEVYNQEYRNIFPEESSFKNDYLDGRMGLLYGSINSLPRVIKGRTFKENERNVAICPIKFYPSTVEADNLGIPKINKSYMIDGQTILGTTFTVTYNVHDATLEEVGKATNSFKIVGLYSSEKTMNSYGECYIPAKDIIEMTHKENINNINNDISDDGHFSYSYMNLDVIIDKTTNVEFTNNEIEKLGYYVSKGASIDTELVTIINISSTVIVIIVLFAVIILTWSYIKKKIINETKTIGILRTSGYIKKDIKKIYLLEIILTNILSYIIGLILFNVIYLLFRETQFYMGLLYLGVRISMNYIIFLFSFMIMILLPALISHFSVSKKMKTDIGPLISNEE